MEGPIGMLGGTFNPVHLGHLVLAQDALERLELSHVFFVPCFIPPHKDASCLLPAEQRLAMLELAIEGDLRFSALDMEIRRAGVSYSVDTVREIRNAHQGADICFIMGADTLPELHLWKDIDTLLEMCRVVPFGRPGIDVGAITEQDLKLKPPWPRRLLDNLAAAHMIQISSSDIRRRVAEGLSIRYLVPPAVEMYIHEHRLYRR